MAYRDYTTAEILEIAEAMSNAATALNTVATQMESEGISPAEFPFSKWLTAFAMDKVASDATIQMKELIRQKRTGQEPAYLRNKIDSTSGALTSTVTSSESRFPSGSNRDLRTTILSIGNNSKLVSRISKLVFQATQRLEHFQPFFWHRRYIFRLMRHKSFPCNKIKFDDVNSQKFAIKYTDPDPEEI